MPATQCTLALPAARLTLASCSLKWMRITDAIVHVIAFTITCACLITITIIHAITFKVHAWAYARPLARSQSLTISLSSITFEELGFSSSRQHEIIHGMRIDASMYSGQRYGLTRVLKLSWRSLFKTAPFAASSCTSLSQP